MNKLNRTDQQLLDRYVDGELAVAERAAFEARLGQDAVLREAVAVARRQACLIHDADPLPGLAPAGFATAVLDTVRRMPSREDLVQQCAEEDSVAAVIHFASRLLMAAVLIVGLALLFGLKVLGPADTGSLHASQQELRELDQKVIAIKAAELQRLGQNR